MSILRIPPNMYIHTPKRIANVLISLGVLLVAAKRRLEDSQRVIESLFKVILLCGMQGLALRGHRDYHLEWDEEKEVSGNQGNFIALVRFRAETDETVKKHLQNAPLNAKYMSKTIQNQLIDIIGKCIQMEILKG